ncbi:zinc finger CCCH domain-containing protein 67-like isoform X1 [Prosopis cineraria]|uniref:zinc finger CCCH domain-containing protein 67-like isoform X1 n=1 Tax=Prosopis cineraria TaxID=364024 RepID=UPI002410719A|nr:zinc finger CCCH domain-containing protein 67-like isoform X1 [Prosopis cineraria]
MDPSESDSTAVSNSIKDPELGNQSASSLSSSHHDPETSDLNPRDETDALQEDLQDKLDLKDKDEGDEEEKGKKDSEFDDGKEVSGIAGTGESEKEQVFNEHNQNWNGNEDDGWGENVNESENDNFGLDNVTVGDKVEKNDGESSSRAHQYPVRPEAEDCAFYLKTGTCKFGFNCKFNHPLRKKIKVVKEKGKEREESGERSGQTECKYYLKSGGCKYGKACKFNHTRGKCSPTTILELNFLGLPIRLGEKECPYYMRTGSCKFGANCKFNHPDPTTVGGSDPPSTFANGGAVSLQGVSQPSIPSWSSPRTFNETAPFVPMMIPPVQGVSPQSSDWNGYQAPVYLPERTMHPPSPYIVNSPAIETNVFMHHPKQMQVEEFPERPGEPECSYYLKTGHCKFKSNCKFHHPKNRSTRPLCTLSDKGLPLRPQDQSVCSHYSRYGICKYGPSCKFDHPTNLSPSNMAGLDQESSCTDFASVEVAEMAGSRGAGDSAVKQPV